MKLQKLFDGKMIRHFRFKYFVIMCLFHYGKSVPIDYCLQPLDKRDCGLKPTPVFSYYKPGSRCEVELWRGCPTFNKFPDEYLCSHHCIGKLYDRVVDNAISSIDFVDPEMQDEEFDQCKLPMKEGDCGVQGKYKYTFVDYLCIRVEWKGCKSHNLFDDEASCMRACSTPATIIKDKLDDLPFEDVKIIDEILDNVMTEPKQNVTAKPKQLKLMYKIPIEDTTKYETKTIFENTEPVYIQPPTTTVAEAVSDATEKIIDSKTVAAIDPIEVPTEPTEAPTDAVTFATTIDITTVTVGTTEAPETPVPYGTTTKNEYTPPQTTPENSGSVDEVIVT